MINNTQRRGASQNAAAPPQNTCFAFPWRRSLELRVVLRESRGDSDPQATIAGVSTATTIPHKHVRVVLPLTDFLVDANIHLESRFAEGVRSNFADTARITKRPAG